MKRYDQLLTAMLSDARAIPAVALAALTDVLNGTSAIRAVRHPLGFLCLPLERDGGRGVCVHVWSDQLERAPVTTTTTHAHSWDLVSCVLYGGLRNDVIAVADAPESPTHRVFEVDSVGDVDELRRTGRLVRPQARTGVRYYPGEVYTLPAGVFHETVPIGETATIALGDGRAGKVDLALGQVHTRTHRLRRLRCDREQTAFAASLVAARVATIPRPRQQEDQCERRGN